MRGLLMGGGKSAATGTGLTGVRNADIGRKTVGLLRGEEEDPFGALDDGAHHGKNGQEGEVVFDLERHVGRSDQGGSAVEDLQRLGTADAMIGVIRRPQLEAGGDVGADGATAVDVTLLDAGDLREVQMDRGQATRGQAETQAELRARGQRLSKLSEGHRSGF